MKTILKQSLLVAALSLAFGSAYAFEYTNAAAASLSGATASTSGGNSGAYTSTSGYQIAGAQARADTDRVFEDLPGRGNVLLGESSNSSGETFAVGGAQSQTVTWGRGSSAMSGTVGGSSASAGSADAFRVRNGGGFTAGSAESANVNMAATGSRGWGVAAAGNESGNESSYNADALAAQSYHFGRHHGYPTNDLVVVNTSAQAGTESSEHGGSFDIGNSFAIENAHSWGDANAVAGAGIDND